ncbi:unnamed protein product, partial [Musa textilis]
KVFVLLPHPNIQVICTFSHKELQTGPSVYSSGNYYCKKTQLGVSAYPNFHQSLKYMLLRGLQEF